MDSNKRCVVVSRWIFKRSAPLERSILPQNDVRFFKIGLEMTSQRSFKVGRLIETAIDGCRLCQRGLVTIFCYCSNSDCRGLYARKDDHILAVDSKKNKPCSCSTDQDRLVFVQESCEDNFYCVGAWNLAITLRCFYPGLFASCCAMNRPFQR